MNDNTLCIYHGPANNDNRDIVVLVTGITRPSTNTKTLDMAQVFIMFADESPTTAVITGNDEVVCGQCFLRPIIANQLKETGDSFIPCYVDKARGPGSAWKSWHMGNVVRTSPLMASIKISTLKACACELVAGDANAGHTRAKCPTPGKSQGVRLGAYGDPASVPGWVWNDLLAMLDKSAKLTSYTHQWADHPELADYTMASIDPITWPDVNGAIDKAHSLGFRTYRVLAYGEQPRLDEILCPEANKKTNCNKCGLCSGNMRPNTPSIAIPAIRPGK